MRKQKLNEAEEIKKEIRVIGIDDAPFKKSDSKCMIIGTIFRGGNYIDGLISGEVKIDGEDSTENISRMIRRTRHYGQLNCIILDGIAVAGFNVVDIKSLNKKTSLPVIVIMRKLPSIKKIEMALNSFMRKEEAGDRMKLIKKAGSIYSVKIEGRRVYFQAAGISQVKAAEIIRVTSTHSLIPEPLRVAHLIAAGIMNGESRGRA